MTRSQFAEIVSAFVATHGRAYLTDETDLNEFYNERLAAYSYRTYCLFDDAIALTLVSGTPTYDLRALAKLVFHPMHVVIDGSVLYDYDGQPGPVAALELMRQEPTYLVSTAAPPLRWCYMPPSTIRLWPKPDAVYSNCFVGGYYLHPVIATNAGGDATELTLPVEHQRTAAVFAAIDLMEPNAAADSDYARMKVLDPRAAADMRRHEERAKELLQRGTLRRGSRFDRPTRRLGG